MGSRFYVIYHEDCVFVSCVKQPCKQHLGEEEIGSRTGQMVKLSCDVDPATLCIGVIWIYNNPSVMTIMLYVLFQSLIG